MVQKPIIVEMSDYLRECLREDEEFIPYRARANAPEVPSALLLILASVHPRLESLKKVEHEYSLCHDFDTPWAVRPLAHSRCNRQKVFGSRSRWGLQCRNPFDLPISVVMMNLQLVERANIARPLRRGAGNCIELIWFALLLVFFLSTSSCWGVDPMTHISQYRHSAWRMKDGVLRGQPNVITQTKDGYIWIGTAAGLMRFDGVRLIPWEPPAGSQLPSPDVRALLAARDGSLWIGTDVGLSHWTQQNLVTYLKEPGIVSSILEDRLGTIWVTRTRLPEAAEGALCQISGAKLKCYRVPDESSTGGCCNALAEDPSGDLWMGSSTGLWRWHDGSLSMYPNKSLEPNAGFDGVESTVPASDGSLWVGIDHGGPGVGLERFVQGSWKPFRQPGLDGSKLQIASLFMDRDGALWVGTWDRGIYRIRDSRADHFSSAEGLSSNSIYQFYQDREGNIWVATSQGIDCFRDIPVVSFSIEEGLSADNVVSVLVAHDGAVWVGNPGGLDAIRGGAVSSIRTGQGLPGNQVTSLFEDRDRRLWVGVDDRLWIYQDGRFIEIRRADGSHVGTVAGITEDGEGNIWAVTIAPSWKLVRIRALRVVEEILPPHIPVARALAADQRAGIWLGLRNGGLARFRNGNTETFSFDQTNNLPVRQVVVNADGSVLGATAGGLIGWKDGKLQTMTVRNGLPCNNTFSIVSDQDNYWLYSECGLVEINAAQIQQWWRQPSLALKVKIIDQSDGVRPGEAPFSSQAARSPDGKLWFADNSVLQMFDPADPNENLVSPPVHVEQIVADRKTYDTSSDRTGHLPLPPLIRDLEIDYTALSFVAPEKVRFRYKLEGLDRDWQDVGNRRQAFYTNLPPRHYRFRVAACNNSGVWNEAGAFLDFSIAPAYYQTNWFRALCGAAFLGLLWAVYHVRVRNLRNEEKKFREAVETMPALAFIAMPDGQRTFVNGRWIEYTGLPEKQALGWGWQAALHPDDLSRVIKRWQETLASGGTLEYEARLRRGADGEYHWFQTRAVPMRDKRGKIVKWYGVISDIEDRKRAEELQANLAHITRVNTMVELTASLAHDIKQPIGAAVTNAEACARLLDRDQPDVLEAREAALEIARDARHAAQIIDRVRSLYRKDSAHWDLVDVNEIVGEMVMLLRGESHRYAISLRTDLAEQLPKIKADRVQLQQVFLNLMLNAIEAMKDTGGDLSIRSQQNEDGDLLVSITDNGVGLPAGRTDEIFNAFFTTKSQGTGLGLAITRSIVGSHGGRVWATANSERGTTFYFTLSSTVA
jgi:PAS domain S-box-containing protein